MLLLLLLPSLSMLLPLLLQLPNGSARWPFALQGRNVAPGSWRGSSRGGAPACHPAGVRLHAITGKRPAKHRVRFCQASCTQQ